MQKYVNIWRKNRSVLVFKAKYNPILIPSCGWRAKAIKAFIFVLLFIWVPMSLLEKRNLQLGLVVSTQQEFIWTIKLRSYFVSSFCLDRFTRERMCFAISAEALGFAAFRALSDISSIFFLSPIMYYKCSYQERRNNKKNNRKRVTCRFFMVHEVHLGYIVLTRTGKCWTFELVI